MQPRPLPPIKHIVGRIYSNYTTVNCKTTTIYNYILVDTVILIKIIFHSVTSYLTLYYES